MPISDKEKAFELMLEFNPVFKHTMIVTKMQFAGWSHPGQHPLLGIYRTQSMNSFRLR
jgi:hypothetical protein